MRSSVCLWGAACGLGESCECVSCVCVVGAIFLQWRGACFVEAVLERLCLVSMSSECAASRARASSERWNQQLKLQTRGRAAFALFVCVMYLT